MPTYDELVLVANADALERDGDKIRAFIGALSRGVRDLRADPDEAIEGLLEANPDLDPELQRAAVKVTLPLFVRARGQAVRLAGPGRSGTPSAPGCRRRTCWSSRRTCAASTTTGCCPAPGL